MVSSNVGMGGHLSDHFPVHSGLKQGIAYYHCFLTLL